MATSRLCVYIINMYSAYIYTYIQRGSGSLCHSLRGSFLSRVWESLGCSWDVRYFLPSMTQWGQRGRREASLDHGSSIVLWLQRKSEWLVKISSQKWYATPKRGEKNTKILHFCPLALWPSFFKPLLRFYQGRKDGRNSVMWVPWGHVSGTECSRTWLFSSSAWPCLVACVLRFLSMRGTEGWFSQSYVSPCFVPSQGDLNQARRSEAVAWPWDTPLRIKAILLHPMSTVTWQALGKCEGKVPPTIGSRLSTLYSYVRFYIWVRCVIFGYKESCAT